MNCVGSDGSIGSGAKDKWCQEMDCIRGEGINGVGDIDGNYRVIAVISSC